jgi:hypothetical protein
MSDLELPLKPVISQSAGGMRAAARTPAVVIGADVNGLGSIRSLGQAGVPVFVLDDDRWHPGMHSRYARPSAGAARRTAAFSRRPDRE